MRVGIFEVTENDRELRIDNRLSGESTSALLLVLCIFLIWCSLGDIHDQVYYGIASLIGGVICLALGLLLFVICFIRYFFPHRALPFASRGPEGPCVLGKAVGRNAALRVAPRFGAFAVILDADGARPRVLHSFHWRRDAEDLAAMVAQFLSLPYTELS